MNKTLKRGTLVAVIVLTGIYAACSWSRKDTLIETAHANRPIAHLAACDGNISDKRYLNKLKERDIQVNKIFEPVTSKYPNFEAHFDIEVRNGKVTAVTIRPDSKYPKDLVAALTGSKFGVLEQKTLAALKDLELPNNPKKPSCIITVRYTLGEPTEDETRPEEKGNKRYNSPDGNPFEDEGGMAIASL